MLQIKRALVQYLETHRVVAPGYSFPIKNRS